MNKCWYFPLRADVKYGMIVPMYVNLGDCETNKTYIK